MEVATKIPLTSSERLEHPTELRLKVSWEEFLAHVERMEYPVNYLNGEMVSIMGYGTDIHEELLANIITELRQILNRKDYRVYGSNLAIKPPELPLGKSYFNADCSVVAGKPQLEQLSSGIKGVTNLSLIVEILSPTTMGFDIGAKFRYYKTIPTLQQVMYLYTDQLCIQSFYRQNNGKDWLLREFSPQLPDVPVLDQASLSLTAIYDGIELSEADQ